MGVAQALDEAARTTAAATGMHAAPTKAAAEHKNCLVCAAAEPRRRQSRPRGRRGYGKRQWRRRQLEDSRNARASAAKTKMEDRNVAVSAENKKKKVNGEAAAIAAVKRAAAAERAVPAGEERQGQASTAVLLLLLAAYCGWGMFAAVVLCAAIAMVRRGMAVRKSQEFDFIAAMWRPGKSRKVTVAEERVKRKPTARTLIGKDSMLRAQADLLDAKLKEVGLEEISPWETEGDVPGPSRCAKIRHRYGVR